MERKSWNAWGDDPKPAPKEGTLSLLWLKLRRLAPTRPTAAEEHEGQIRYDRDGDVNGVAYIAQYLAGGTYQWGQVALTATSGVALINTGYFTPPGPGTIDATQVTVLTTGLCGARYLGMTPYAVTSIEINVRVVTMAAIITWAEVALASGSNAAGANLTLLGSATSVAATFNSTGVKVVTFTVSIPANTFVYLLFGSSATTPFQLRATIADELNLGVVRSATARPSTMAAPTSFSASSAITAAAYVAVRWS